MIFGGPKRSQIGAPKGIFWEAPKTVFFIFWGSQKAPRRGLHRSLPSEKKGLPLEAFDIFFGNLQLGRSRGGEGWATQKSTWKINLVFFWGSKVGPSGAPKYQENDLGKNRKKRFLFKNEGFRNLLRNASGTCSGTCSGTLPEPAPERFRNLLRNASRTCSGTLPEPAPERSRNLLRNTP